jgi:hypothetical protein
MTARHVPVVSRYTPPGLPKRAATFAVCLLSPMPIAQVRPVRAATAACSVRASASGSSVSAPTNASSQPHTSTGIPNDRSTAITSAEAAS